MTPVDQPRTLAAEPLSERPRVQSKSKSKVTARRDSTFMAVEEKTEIPRFRVLHPPSHSDPGLLGNLRYALWDEPALALIGIWTPLLTLFSIFSLGLITYCTSGDLVQILGASLMMIPAGYFLLNAFGFVLSYFREALLESARGGSLHPRWPDWGFFLSTGEVFQWGLAVVPASALGIAPALYRLTTIGLDPVSWVLLGVGFAVASGLSVVGLVGYFTLDDFAALSPFRVVKATFRMGFGFAFDCAAAGLFGVGLTWTIKTLYEKELPVLAIPVLIWLVWVVSIVILLGLLHDAGLRFHHRRKAIGWFKES